MMTRALPVLALLLAGCGGRAAPSSPTAPPHETVSEGYDVRVVVIDPADLAAVDEVTGPEGCSPPRGNTIPCGPPERNHDVATATKVRVEAALQAAGLSSRARVELTARETHIY